VAPSGPGAGNKLNVVAEERTFCRHRYGSSGRRLWTEDAPSFAKLWNARWPPSASGRASRRNGTRIAITLADSIATAEPPGRWLHPASWERQGTLANTSGVPVQRPRCPMMRQSRLFKTLPRNAQNGVVPGKSRGQVRSLVAGRKLLVPCIEQPSRQTDLFSCRLPWWPTSGATKRKRRLI
jgi:hypothetical protein